MRRIKLRRGVMVILTSVGRATKNERNELHNLFALVFTNGLQRPKCCSCYGCDSYTAWADCHSSDFCGRRTQPVAGYRLRRSAKRGSSYAPPRRVLQPSFMVWLFVVTTMAIYLTCSLKLSVGLSILSLLTMLFAPIVFAVVGRGRCWRAPFPVIFLQKVGVL